MRYVAPVSCLILSLCGNAAAQSVENAATAQSQATDLDKITVTGQRPQQGYAAEASEALGFALSLQKTPATINVITDDFLRDSGARRLTDILNYIPGVTNADNGGTPSDTLTIRGFGAGATYYNGLRQAVTTQQRRSLDNIERIEIVKGPAGVEGGVADPGGTANLITKKPQREFGGSVEAGIGSYGYRRIAGDVTGALAADGALQGRLIAAYGEGAEWRPGRPDETPYWTIAPSLEFEYGHDSRVLLEYQRIESDDPLDRGIIYLRGAGFRDDFAPRDWSIHQRGDSMEIDSDRIDFTLEHRFGDVFSAHLRAQDYREDVGGGGFRNGETEGEFLYSPDGLTWNGINRAIPIFLDDSRTEVRSRSYQAEGRAVFPIGATRHALKAGWSRNENDDAFVSGKGDFRYVLTDNTVDLFDSDNDQAPSIVGFETFGDFLRGNRVDALYGQWLAEWTPRWRTVLGLREDDYAYFAQETATEPGEPPPFEDRYDDRNLSWRAATSFDFTSDVSGFVGYSDAYQPQGGLTRSGARIEPLRARSAEAGIKVALAGGRALWSTALYQITQDNIAATDPGNAPNENFLILFGEARIRGIETELVGRIADALEVSAGLAVQDAEILENADGFTGNRFANTPRAQASVFASYAWDAFDLPQLTTRAGVFYIGEREANSANQYQLPAYTRLDLGATYAFSPQLSLSLNVENALDETYYTAAQNSGAGADQVAVGNRRLAQLHLRYAF